MAIVKLKKASVFILAICLFFSACNNNPQTISESSSLSSTAETNPDQSQFMWGIEAISCEATDNLSTSQSVVQYGGTTEEISYEAKPGNGNTFLLVQMIIEKQEAGAATFEWDKLYVLDKQGNKYYRHPNDIFLADHNFKRLKSTDLTFGKSEGFVCFEISKQALDNPLILIYEAPEGENKIALVQGVK